MCEVLTRRRLEVSVILANVRSAEVWGLSIEDTIPVMRPRLPSIDLVYPYLSRMDGSRTYSNFGPLAQEYTERIAVRLNVADPARVVLTSNATIALEGAYTLLDATSYQVPAFTFPATAHAVIRAQKNLKIVDIHESDWRINSNRSENPSSGIVTVSPFGAPPFRTSGADGTMEIIDAAASLGAEPLNLADLPTSAVVIFSVHATKAFGIGEGGIAVFGDINLAKQFKTWLNFGFSGSRESQIVATNGKMSEIAAAYGLAVTDNWEQERDEWRVANNKAKAITKRAGLWTPLSKLNGVAPYWIVQFPDSTTAREAEARLTLGGVETRRWWEKGLHKMPAFKEMAGDDYPVTDDIASRTIGLPMYRDLNEVAFQRIEEALLDL